MWSTLTIERAHRFIDSTKSDFFGWGIASGSPFPGASVAGRESCRDGPLHADGSAIFGPRRTWLYFAL